MNIELHIEELVLHGFAPGDRHRIAAAVEHELARLLAERGPPRALATSGEIERLGGGVFAVTPAAEAIGVQIARQVYEGLER